MLLQNQFPYIKLLVSFHKSGVTVEDLRTSWQSNAKALVEQNIQDMYDRIQATNTGTIRGKLHFNKLAPNYFQLHPKYRLRGNTDRPRPNVINNLETMQDDIRLTMRTWLIGVGVAIPQMEWHIHRPDMNEGDKQDYIGDELR